MLFHHISHLHFVFLQSEPILINEQEKERHKGMKDRIKRRTKKRGGKHKQAKYRISSNFFFCSQSVNPQSNWEKKENRETLGFANITQNITLSLLLKLIHQAN